MDPNPKPEPASSDATDLPAYLMRSGWWEPRTWSPPEITLSFGSMMVLVAGVRDNYIVTK